MAIIYGQPNRVIYVKPKFTYKEAFIREGERKEYFFVKPDFILIADQPIKIEFPPITIETKDHVILNDVKLCIAFKPNITSENDKILKCVAAYENNTDKENKTKDWFKELLNHKLPNKLTEYIFSSIIDKEIIEDLEKWFLEQVKDYNFLVDKNSLMIEFKFEEKNLDPANLHHQSIIEYFNKYKTKSADLKETEREILELQQQYNKKIEDITNQHIQVMMDLGHAHSRSLKQKEKDHLLAIENLENTHLSAKKDLENAHSRSLEKKEKDHTLAMQGLENEYALSKNKLEYIHLKNLEEYNNQRELELQKIRDENNFSIKDSEINRNKKIHEYEISNKKQNNEHTLETQHMENELTKQLMPLKTALMEINSKLKKDELKQKEELDSIEIDNKFKLIKKESSLIKESGYVSIDDLLKMEQLKYQLNIENINTQIEQLQSKQILEKDKLKFYIQDIPKKISHGRELEITYTKSIIELMQKIYEMQLMLQYHNIHLEENRQISNNLEQLFSKTISSAKGIINDFKVVSINKDIEGTITKLFSGMLEIFSQAGSIVPALSPALKDFIRDFNFKSPKTDRVNDQDLNQEPNPEEDSKSKSRREENIDDKNF